MDDAQRSAIADSVRMAHRALFAATQSRNVDSIMSYFTGEAGFAEAGMLYPSRDSLVNAARNFFGGTRSVAVTTAEPVIVVLGPNAAALATTFRESVVDTAGHTIDISGAWSAVYRREAGRWMVVQAHESFPVPAPTQAPAPRRRS